MTQVTRRNFIKAAGTCAALGTLASVSPHVIGKGHKGRVIVIGGGYGGTIAAKYIKMADPDIDVTLIEKDPKYVSCPLSNEVLSGERKIESITFGDDVSGEILCIRLHAKLKYGSVFFFAVQQKCCEFGCIIQTANQNALGERIECTGVADFIKIQRAFDNRHCLGGANVFRLIDNKQAANSFALGA